MSDIFERTDFIAKNTQFLSCYHDGKIDSTILVEESGLCPSCDHLLGILLVMFFKGKKLKPLFIRYDQHNDSLVKSYVPCADSIALPVLHGITRIFILLQAIVKIFLLRTAKDIINITYDGVQYGDFVYDEYLRNNEFGALDFSKLAVKWDLVCILRSLMERHESLKKVIIKEKISAVLTTHNLNFESGTLFRCGLRMGCTAYYPSSRGAGDFTLRKFETLEEMKQTPLTPTYEELMGIANHPEFNDIFTKVKKEHLSNKGYGAENYKNNSEIHHTRRDFCQLFKLDENKKNIFVMLHAFTDHPHSTANCMIFDDYADWFFKTLNYAKKDSSVNWFFKRHPWDVSYPTKDIDFHQIFEGLPAHITFLDLNAPFNNNTIGQVADWIITGQGSAGFEIPALYGIPSISSSDCFYSHYGFAKMPTSEKNYFDLLASLHKGAVLTEIEHKLARAFYVFVYHSATVEIDWLPRFYVGYDQKNYYSDILRIYDERGAIIHDQINRDADLLSNDNFRAFRRL